MATHSSVLAWKIPWTEELGAGHCPWGRKESGKTEQLHFHFQWAYRQKKQSQNINSCPGPGEREDIQHRKSKGLPLSALQAGWGWTWWTTWWTKWTWSPQTLPPGRNWILLCPFKRSPFLQYRRIYFSNFKYIRDDHSHLVRHLFPSLISQTVSLSDDFLLSMWCCPKLCSLPWGGSQMALAPGMSARDCRPRRRPSWNTPTSVTRFLCFSTSRPQLYCFLFQRHIIQKFFF